MNISGREDFTEEIIRVTDLCYRQNKQAPDAARGLLEQFIELVEAAERGGRVDEAFMTSLQSALDAFEQKDLVMFADICMFEIKPMLEE